MIGESSIGAWRTEEIFTDGRVPAPSEDIVTVPLHHLPKIIEYHVHTTKGVTKCV